jgi:aryl-alcohol dehydrogenase-like predicted oxidoreductase
MQGVAKKNLPGGPVSLNSYSFPREYAILLKATTDFISHQRGWIQMKMRRMGRTGLLVSEICLGTMTFGAQCDEKNSFAIMDNAERWGVNFFDTADMYPLPPTIETAGKTEEIVGRWMKGKRNHFVLATKCRFPIGPGPNDVGLSRRHIMEAIDASLRRLQCDYIDLYQVHAPDALTPIDETLRALDDLVRCGKVRYIGCSNYAAWELARALWVSDKLNLARFDCHQPRYNLLYREIEAELLPLCRDQGVGVIAYNPLAAGLLTGKYKMGQAPVEGTRFTLGKSGEVYRARYWQTSHFKALENLHTYLEKRNKPLIEVALAWVLAQEGITSAIVGATRAEQLDQSLPAVAMKLDSDDVTACDAVWYQLPRTPPGAGGAIATR